MPSFSNETRGAYEQSQPELFTQSTSKTRSLDEVLHRCGDLGRFQWLQYCFLSLLHISAGLAAYYYVYGAGEPDHRCRLPPSIWPNDDQYNPINSTHESLLRLFIPKTDDKWDECHVFDSINISKTLVECPNGWVFDRNTFGFTFTEEMNLVCQTKPKKSLLSTLVQTAGFLVLLAGLMADRFGRKQTIVITNIILFTICLIGQIIIQWIPMSINLKFGILLVTQFMAGLTVLTSNIAFIMMLELTTSKYRGLAGNITFMFYASGELLVTLFAYVTRNWQNLLWANTIFIGVSLLFLVFTVESPLYLYSKRRYTDLEKCLRRIAKINNRPDSNWYPQFEELMYTQTSSAFSKQELTFTQSLKQLVSQRTIIYRMLITAFLAFKDTLLYYKISYGLATLEISPYLAILIGGILEAFGYVTATLIMPTRLGRKYSLIIFTALTCVCILIIPFTIARNVIATVIVSQTGKFATSVANSITWIYIAELFPTSIRSSTNGFAMAVSRLGAIAAPIIDASVDEQHLPITFYAYAAVAFVSLLMTLPLPETKDAPLAKTIDIPDNSSLYSIND